jgi:type III restriction enzyme
MELKPYQQQVINDLTAYLEHLQTTKDVREAFHNFWTQHPTTPLQPFPGTAIEPYKNNVQRVPHICLKVPTAGGKTFIACNALKPIFDAFEYDRPKAVLWLVPSITILEQTIRNLKDPSHPYRQRINTHFGNRVEVFDKATLLQGSGFNATTVKEQLSIMVFSFDSLRAKNKEDRKVFQENGNLQSFENLLGNQVDITLGEVIKYLNPVVVVDESHNAESDLSVEMLQSVNPSFILDLTATPRKNSNIISFIDAMELKRENMVKLPVIVYNHHDKTEVINSALQLQRRLEYQALEEEKKGGKYIRPIVLFQAQPRSADDNTTFEKLKEKLVEMKIPADQIRIKTANLNEIKNEDLMSRDCPVRYIITVNALKEGWDCPFAYILASLADKSSSVDVEQILGRVLRQPYVMKHNFPLLNVSYVLTASARFLDTLDNIVKGLNKAGFSERDYKLAEVSHPTEKTDVSQPEMQEFAGLFGTHSTPEVETPESDFDDIDVSRVIYTAPAEPEESQVKEPLSTAVSQLEETAIAQTEAFEQKIATIENSKKINLSSELEKMVKTYPVKEIFKVQAESLRLPQFFLKVPQNDLFGIQEADMALEKENLLEGFALSKCDTNISFDNVSSELYKVDLDSDKKEHTPVFLKLDGSAKEAITAYMLDPARKDSRVKNFTRRIMDIIGNMYPIADMEIQRYIKRILEDFTDEQFNAFADNEYSYTDKIKNKIRELSEEYAEKRFRNQLDTDKIQLKPAYFLPMEIAPSELAKDMPKTLYEKEGRMNSFEERVINEVGNMENIAFWTRNVEKKGFCINGFINHYPDFIIQTKGGKIIVLETKGDHLDAAQKIRLGNLWQSKAGNNFRYYMVYDKRNVEGAYTLEVFLEIVRDL